MPAADRDRPAPQRRVVALFDARVKRVHVDMDDLARGAWGFGHLAMLSYSAAVR